MADKVYTFSFVAQADAPRPSLLGRLASSAALVGIGFYQRRISPRKGFSCAHRVLHGGIGCSGYAKARIAESGLFAAFPDIRRRFSDCEAAAVTLTARRAESSGKNPRARRRERWCDNSCDTVECCSDFGDCGPG